ncbi:hypothetical protein [Priestia megaterium]|uniref:hypothetical protein n=1 Tax=Priestia megaterium TaxID=1404 RepID=UPI002E23C821|nr:hypothetical protein [Priestia megaterium]
MTTVLESKFFDFTNAIKKSLESENWHAALTVSLILPDICGKLQDENLSSNKRYVKWFNRYLKQQYTSFVGADNIEHEFLTGEDMYALRCSFLHAGGVDIENQWIRKVLSGFKFVPPKPNRFVHKNHNEINGTLQLQVDQFCLEICNAVENWVQDFKGDSKVQQKVKMMIDIVDIPDEDNSFS